MSGDNLKLSRSLKKQEKVDLADYLKKQIDRSVISKLLDRLPKLPFSEIVYQFPEDKHASFQERLKARRNLLLICKTENGAILGAFASSGFIDPAKDKKPLVFLFCIKEKAVMMLEVKEGRAGVQKDEDFIIFGNE